MACQQGRWLLASKSDELARSGLRVGELLWDGL